MGSLDGQRDSPETPFSADSTPDTDPILNNICIPTPHQPSRTVSLMPQINQQHTPRQSVDLQHFTTIPASREHGSQDSHQSPASPVSRLPVRSSNVSPVPPRRPASPQIATKFIKASEMAKPTPSQSPLRKGYVVINKDNQENAPPAAEHDQEQKTLYRPKSKLRLRLKLTPPHPAGIKVEVTPTKPSLKVRLLSSSNRTNEQTVRKPSHQQQTSISTIRAHPPPLFYSPPTAVATSPDSSAKALNSNFINYFPTHFNSGSPHSDDTGDDQVNMDREREERERRTAAWYPPAKAIPRSRSAWNLRVDEGKAAKEGANAEGRFESDFDGRASEENGENANGMFGGAVLAKRNLFSLFFAADHAQESNTRGPDIISTTASSTLVPEVDSNPYLKAGFAVSESSFTSQTPYDSTQNESLRSGTPQRYDALAVITAEHPNNSSTSTVNLTLTDSERSSSRASTPDGPNAFKSNKEDITQKQVSPASVASSSPFTLDKSMRKRMESPGEWTDTSNSSALRSPDESFAWSGILTPQKSKSQQQAKGADGTHSTHEEEPTSGKSVFLSPYTHGNPIDMDAVNDWSPSKAFAYTDGAAGAIEPGHASETEPSIIEGEEVLNDSYESEMSGRSQSEGASSHGHHSLAIRAEQADTSAQYAADGQLHGYHAQGTPNKEADISVDSAYMAPIYATPPKLERRKNPHVRRKEKEAKGEVSDDIFSLSDQMLSDRYKFVQEIGFGNWGSVWQCKPRTPAAHPLHRSSVSRNQPSLSHAVASQHHPSKVAIKLVHRSKQATTAARVRALWSEMKIVRTLKAEPHPNIIGFDSFIITPSYALIIMPFLAQLMPVSISEERAKGYFLQLTSALAYLHYNGVTHNDIKPSNIMLSCTNTPIFVDFGFAQKWDVNAVDTGANTLIGGLTTLTGHNASCHELFQSEISWGTPEYLDPQRAKGLKHDERASDVWALGVTFFEILIGRTPFEESEDEQFSTTEQLSVYHDRTVQGKWLGDWSMSSQMKGLLRSMIQPDPLERITARDAHQHPALAIDVNTDMSTPPFVRTAASLPLEPKEKKQVPREKRDQKRSQALQAETGAKFIKSNNKTRTKQVENAGEKGATEAYALAALAQHGEIQPSTRASPPVTKPDLSENAKSIPVDGERASAAYCDDGGAVGVASAAPVVKLSDDAAEAVLVPASQERGYLYDAKAVEPTVPTVQYQSPPQHAARDLRRPASAAALRNVDHSPLYNTHLVAGADGYDKTRYIAQAHDQTNGFVGDTQYLRHSRVASEGAVRLLNGAIRTGAETSGRARPKSQLSFARLGARDETRTQDTLEGLVHFRGDSPWQAQMPIPQALQIQDELADLRNAATPADLDAKLDMIALWVEDVEHIVEEAKYTLRAVQAERPPSRQLLRQLELEQQIEEGHRPSIHMVRPPSAAGDRVQNLRKPSSSLHLRYESNYELAPIVQMGDFKPTHLRRQRSDLTNFRSRANLDIEELRRQDYELRGYDEWPESRAKGDFAKKLKTYRSTGDLHRLADLRKKEHDKILEEIERNNRDTERWYRTEGRRAYLVQEQKKVHQESRLKSMFHSVKSIFKRRE